MREKILKEIEEAEAFEEAEEKARKEAEEETEEERAARIKAIAKARHVKRVQNRLENKILTEWRNRKNPKLMKEAALLANTLRLLPMKAASEQGFSSYRSAVSSLSTFAEGFSLPADKDIGRAFRTVRNFVKKNVQKYPSSFAQYLAAFPKGWEQPTPKIKSTWEVPKKTVPVKKIQIKQAEGALFGGELSKAQKAMAEELAKRGARRGVPMDIEKADRSNTNPKHDLLKEGAPLSDYQKYYGYWINCQTCAPAYLLRRLGFNVEAKANDHFRVTEDKKGVHVYDKTTAPKEYSPGWVAKSHNGFRIWLDSEGKVVDYGSDPTYSNLGTWMNNNGIKRTSTAMYMQFYKESTTEPGIYIVCVSWGNYNGHYTILERKADGSLIRVEPQVYESYKTGTDLLEELCYSAYKGSNSLDLYAQGIMRIDNKAIRPEVLDNFILKEPE